MTRTIRVSIQILPILVLAGLAGAGCSSGDDGNKAAFTATGGSTSIGTGGSNAGAAALTGGSSNTAGTGTGGSSAGAPSGCSAPSFYTDGQCDSTVSKGAACTTEGSVCDKNCGPGNSGFKTETCTGGVIVESSTCTFPASCNFGCFKVPTADSPNCPPAASPPQHNQPCSAGMAMCNLPCNQTTPCEMCGVAAGYLDSSGAAKVGYCVCIPSTSDAGSKWACATFPTAWPCPSGAGCGA
jgi:hypothetical protein